MYIPTAGGSALDYWGEHTGSGVTASNPYAINDQPPDIATLPIFGDSPSSQPIFRTETTELDRFRLLALVVGVFIGWKLLK